MRLKLVPSATFDRCRRCDRLLTNEDSKARGYGPTCLPAGMKPARRSRRASSSEPETVPLDPRQLRLPHVPA